MTLEELLNIADQAYDGLVPFWDCETRAPALDDKLQGDTLALFVVRELVQTFDPSCSGERQLNDAIVYMEGAKSDIESVIGGLATAVSTARLALPPSLDTSVRLIEGNSPVKDDAGIIA